MARLEISAPANPPGSLDLSFSPPLMNGQITAVAVQPDGRILIGGTFTIIDNEPHARLARLNANGSLDRSFNPSLAVEPRMDYPDFSLLYAGPVSAIVLDAQEKILIGGSFSAANGKAIRGIVRLNPDGSLDTTFDPGSGVRSISSLDYPFVTSVARDSMDRILVAGAFNSLDDVPRPSLARLNSDGSVDLSFNPALPFANARNPTVNTMAVERNGDVLIGGSFTAVNSPIYRSIVRYRPNGSLDTNFNPVLHLEIGPSTALFVPAVSRISTQADGGILVAGSFTHVHDTERNRIARLLPDGSLDPSFRTGSGITEFFYPSGQIVPYPQVRSIAVLPGGGVVIGGAFNQIGGAPLSRLARLTSDGSVDLSFFRGKGIEIGSAYWQYVVSAIAAQTDGKIVIAGSFNRIDGVGRTNIARLHGDDFTLRPPTILRQPASQTMAEATNAMLTVLADGFPLHYQWRFNEKGLAGATNDTLVLGSVTRADSGNYSVVVSNAFGSVTSSNAVLRVIDIAEALDGFGLVWKTGSYSDYAGYSNTVDKPWIAQTEVTHDGFDALSSPYDPPFSCVSWIETTVTGPGTLSFWWKATADTVYSRNGAVERWVTRGASWTKVGLNVPEGVQRLRWTYYNPVSTKEVAYLDEVIFTPLSLSVRLLPNTRQIELGVQGSQAGTNYGLEISTDLIRWSNLTIFEGATTPVQLTDPDIPAPERRFYRLRVR